jgi:hypothetical protein
MADKSALPRLTGIALTEEISHPQNLREKSEARATKNNCLRKGTPQNMGSR